MLRLHWLAFVGGLIALALGVIGWVIEGGPRSFGDVVVVVDLTIGGSEAGAKLEEVFGKKPKYADVPGLCKAATIKEIEAQGWSLNPGRYVGVAPGEAVSDEDFKEQLETLNEELESLSAQARELEATIAKNVAEILEA